MVIRRLVHLSIVLLLTTLSCQFIQSIIPSRGNSAAVGGALLNEVLFLPVQGQVGFVEIKSPGKRVSLTGLYLVNERGDSYSLPDGINALSPDEFLLIIFDGTNIVEDKTIHASQTGFLNSGSGFIELYASDGILLDRVSWGAVQPGSVNLSRGGDVTDLDPGTSIGRFPLSIRMDALEWTVFSSVQVTAGAANPQPGVEVMIPLNGAVIKQLSFELSWYPAPGALEYHVQVSADESFNAPAIDDTVSEPALTVNMQPGTYFWRVRAMAQDGAVADFSPVQKITINPGASSTNHLAAPQRQASLVVPFMSQHKDTAMLLLESKNESGFHAWDIAHPEMDPADPADNANCALASIAMINAYLGGEISQDRLGYELYKDVWPGPEYDLNYGHGTSTSQEQQLLTFALDAEPTYRPAPETTDVIWADIQWEIDEGRPIFASKPGHAFVITGYYEGTTTRYVMINDPWWGQYAVDLEAVPWGRYFMISPDSIPVFGEPEIGMNSDDDEVVDFDETERFHTDPHSDDSDKDDVKDKDDVLASIFDDHFGYALTGELDGRDYDGDGVAMELDEDADGGGCFDGMEDFDLDGKYKRPETWNFDEKDDACFWGTNELVLDDTDFSEDGSSIHQYQRFFAKFSLRAVEDGKLEGIAQVSYTHTGESIEVDADPCTGTATLVGGVVQYWQVDLNGDFQKLHDGSTLVSFETTPDHGPTFSLQWIGPCSSDPISDEGWPFDGMGGTLKDGVYDLFTDLSSADYDKWWQKIHMEQGQGME
jgi:Peptidase_C39 like family